MDQEMEHLDMVTKERDNFFFEGKELKKLVENQRKLLEGMVSLCESAVEKTQLVSQHWIVDNSAPGTDTNS